MSVVKEATQSNHYQPQHQPNYFQCRMDNNPDFLEKSRESYSDLKQDVSNKGLLCAIWSSILEDIEAIYQFSISLTVSNALPNSDIRLGTNDYEKAFLLGFWDSCTAMNTRDLLMHQLIITQHPQMVEK